MRKRWRPPSIEHLSDEHRTLLSFSEWPTIPIEARIRIFYVEAVGLLADQIELHRRRSLVSARNGRSERRVGGWQKSYPHHDGGGLCVAGCAYRHLRRPLGACGA